MKLSTNRLEALPFSEVKISPVQLAFLQIGFLFGSSAINNPATAARQDAWLAFLVGWAGGALLIGIYILISRLNPGMTLVDILLSCFGKIAGTILSLFYIWYFIHLASLVIRNFGDYMKTINYPQTPLLIIAVALTAVAAYSIRKGLESTGRTSEVLVPLLPLSVILIFLYVFNEYNADNFLPILENGLRPVLRAGLNVMTFPFGSIIVFLTLYVNLDKKKKLAGSVFASVSIVGVLLLMIIARDTMALGPDIMERAIYAPDITSRLVPFLTVYPLVSVNFLIGGAARAAVCIYGAAASIARIARLDDYVPLVLPLAVLTVVMSIWLFDNTLEISAFIHETWAFYSLPLQVFIPILMLVISAIKYVKDTQ